MVSSWVHNANMYIRAKQPPRGVTLIELMVTITILGILGTLAAPSFRNMLVNNRLSNYNNDFVGLAAFARAEAVKRGTTVTMCRSSSLTSCAASGEWAQGWIVYLGNAAAGNSGTPVNVLQTRAALPAGYTLTGSGALAAAVEYDARGFVVSTGSFTLCHAATGNGRQISIDRTRITVASLTSCT